MKLIIAGSRAIWPEHELLNGTFAQHNLWTRVNEIVSGGAQGVDKAGEGFSKFWSYNLKCFPANWEQFGKSAGHLRNLEMGEYADALLLIWDGESRGSADMKEIMQVLNKPIYEYVLRCSP